MKHWLLVVTTSLLLTSSVSGSDIEARYRSGITAFQQGNPLQAIEWLGSVASEQPNYLDTQMVLGRSYLLVGLNLPAKQHFERALADNPANSQAAFLLGFSLYQAARYFEAAQTLERAGVMSPQNPLPKMYRGLTLMRLGDAEKARLEIELALRLAPQDLVARAAYAELELLEGNYTQAEEYIRGVLAENSLHENGQLLLGRVLLESGRPSEAIPIFSTAVDNNQEKNSELLYLLGQAQLRSGNSAAGKTTLGKFRNIKEKESRLRILYLEVSTDPKNLQARLQLTQMLVELDQLRGAQLQLATLQKQAPRDPRVVNLAERLLQPLPVK